MTVRPVSRPARPCIKVQQPDHFNVPPVENNTPVAGVQDIDDDGGGSGDSEPEVEPPAPTDTGGRGGITQGVSFEFFESFLLIYSHNTHWVNFEFF